MNLTLPIVASPKALNTSGGINHSLLSSKKRVTLTAQFHFYLFFRGTNSEGITTGAGRLRIPIIGGVNLLFH
jgi:hypothetical protein